MTPRRRTGLIAVLAVAGLLVAGRIAAGLFVQYEWYDALGARDVWMAMLANGLLLRGGTGVVAALFALANLYVVRRSIVSVVLPRRMGDLEIGEEVPARYLTAGVVLLSLVLGVLLALPSHGWAELVLARTGVPFNESEAYFDRDLGFFVYWLPFETELYSRALSILAAVTCVVVVLYFFFTPGLRYEKSKLRMSVHVRQHVAVLSLFAFAALAWSYRLEMYGALHDGSGPLGMFSYVDKYSVIPINLALSFLTLAAGVAIAIALWRNQRKTALWTVTAVLVAPFLAFRIGRAVIEQFGPAHDAVASERPYRSIRATYNAQAFGADSARLPDAPPGLAIASPIELAREVSIWDPAAIAQSVRRAHRTATVFDGLAWRESPVGPVATVIERPANSERIVAEQISGTLSDDRGAVVRVDSMGRPDQLDLFLPPALVYEGAGTDTVVADTAGIIAAPGMDGWLSRVAHAWSAQNLRLLAEDLPDRNPKIVGARDVHARLKALVPFVVQGATVWPAVYADSLYWVVDLYAASDAYPLSQRLALGDGRYSYFLHAATAFVQAYSGRVLLVRDRELDPVARTWVTEFPRLFTTWERIPVGLAAQAPPRIDAATAAANGYARRSTELADSAAPVRAVPTSDSGVAGGPGSPVACYGLPAAHTACAWAVPLVDAQSRVAGLIIATGGARPAVFRYRPRRTIARKWTEIGDRLERSDSTTPLLLGTGMRLFEGRVRAVPYLGGIAFVQPEFAWPADGAPTLNRVTVVSTDSAGSARTLAQAVGVAPVEGRVAAGPMTAAEFRGRVEVLYDAMQAALKRGDLTGFGTQFNALGRLLGRSRGP